MTKHTILIAAVAAIGLPSMAMAQARVEAPSAVTTFKDVCLTGGIESKAKIAALEALGWKQDATATIDVPKLGISRAIDRNFDFSKPDNVKQWSGSIDGRKAQFTVATFPAKRRYPNLCALVIDDIANAMPYADETKAAFKSFGISGKSVDLVHYFEFAGKIGPEKHPARGEIFTRSLASGARNSMHIYLAY